MSFRQVWVFVCFLNIVYFLNVYFLNMYFLNIMTGAQANEGVIAPPPSPEKTTLEKKAPRAKSMKTEKRRDRRTPLEKETEGTEALDRFEAETVLKSKYQIDGQPLEVDPD